MVDDSFRELEIGDFVRYGNIFGQILDYEVGESWYDSDLDEYFDTDRLYQVECPDEVGWFSEQAIDGPVELTEEEHYLWLTYQLEN